MRKGLTRLSLGGIGLLSLCSILFVPGFAAESTTKTYSAISRIFLYLPSAILIGIGFSGYWAYIAHGHHEVLLHRKQGRWQTFFRIVAAVCAMAATVFYICNLIPSLQFLESVFYFSRQWFLLHILAGVMLTVYFLACFGRRPTALFSGALALTGAAYFGEAIYGCFFALARVSARGDDYWVLVGFVLELFAGLFAMLLAKEISSPNPRRKPPILEALAFLLFVLIYPHLLVLYTVSPLDVYFPGIFSDFPGLIRFWDRSSWGLAAWLLYSCIPFACFIGLMLLPKENASENSDRENH